MLLLYSVLFWAFTTSFIFLRSIPGDQPILTRKEPIFGHRWTKYVLVVLKILPAFIATIFVIVLRPSNSLFYFLMALGLFCSLLGDIGMEIKFLTGVSFFAIAQIIFTTGFLTQSIVIGVNLVGIGMAGFTLFILAVYFYILYRYLQSSGRGLGRFRVPLLFYVALLSLMSSTTVLLWHSSGAPLGFVIVLGAISFIISDSLIGIREFHHVFSHSQLKVLGTYYLAIFLLSMAVLLY